VIVWFAGANGLFHDISINNRAVIYACVVKRLCTNSAPKASFVSTAISGYMNRIIFVNLQGRIAGAETSLLLLTKHLRNRFHIIVACPAKSPFSRALRSMGVDCVKLPPAPRRSLQSPLSLPYWLRAIRQLTTAALRLKPDIIHANSFYAAPISVVAARIAGKSLVVHARDMNRSRLFCRFFNRFCEKIIAVSTAVKNSLIRLGIEQHKIVIVYNGVDSDMFEQAGNIARASVNGSNAPFVFANIGQFVPWKNQTAFLRAASLVAPKLPNAKFMLVGDDIFERNHAYKKTLLNLAKDFPIADKLCITGWQANMEHLWHKVDCLVHTAHGEPFGRIVIEAMAHKIPVIAADSGGPCEIIADGKTGLLADPDNIEQLSDAMLKVARDKHFAQRLAWAGFEHVKANFTAQMTAATIEEIYTELLIR